ncbi:ATP-dependent helicase [Marinospirillum sp.]|uniref:ATP-dependent helicase n=1 Tax=Marinospirillum sp. TaxID=2183934 RepID=UPI003A89A6F4
MLTPEQQAVVHHQQGHARVRAVAGSGKTTTLVARVVHLLKQQVPAQRILVVMYNRAAKEDFQAKLMQALAGTPLRPPDVRTFHSLGHRLTESFVRWGVLPRRRLVQEEWMVDRLTRQALTLLAQEQNEEAAPWLEEETLEGFKSFCTLVKSGLEPAADCYASLNLSGQHQHFVAAFARLEALLEQEKLMFFDDLLWRPVLCLQQQPDLEARLQGYLEQVIVDEYQDINAVQQRLLKALVGQAQVMVVGDVDQCIYEWRGARPEYMLKRFATDFSPVTDYPLSRTFRFGHALALAANQVIQHNLERPPQVTLASPEAQPVTLMQGQGAAWLLHTYQAAPAEQQQEAAILVRSWSQSLAVQLAFLKAHQPFRLLRQEHFIFNRPQIKGLMAYARLAFFGQSGQALNFEHPKVQQDFDQLLSFPTLYLSEAERQQCVQVQRQAGSVGLEAALAQWPVAKRRRVQQRLKLLEQLRVKAHRLSPVQLIDQIMEATRAPEVLRKAASHQEAADEALRLIEGLRRYAERGPASLEAWIAELEQAQQEGSAMQAQQQEGIPLILTIHAAKGLEWRWVGLYGLNEGDFPYTGRFGRLSTQQEEAERRLFYVAMTRAKHALVLVSGDTASPVSRFVEEAQLQDALRLAEALMQAEPPAQLKAHYPELQRHYWQQVHPSAAPRFLAIELDNTADAMPSPARSTRADPLSIWRPGAEVEHPRFGRGRLLDIQGDQPKRLCRVEFTQAGVKTLHEAWLQLA